MYKVVIIDDEPIIVEGLTKIIHWEDLGCSIVGTAENGIEGQKLIRSFEPDLIVTDISMPGLDGLNMIAAIRSEYPDTEICILTGYRDFDYAQKAINLGVSRFLLKPSNPTQIEEAVRAMIANLKRRGMTADTQDGELPDISAEQERTGESKKNEGGASGFIVNSAIAYMKEHYREHLTLSDVADHVYVSQWHLSKLLNRHQEQSFSEILNEIRITNAKELLRDPSLRIGDIAEMVGFLDLAHFSRAFKKYVGISANEYRNTRL